MKKYDFIYVPAEDGGIVVDKKGSTLNLSILKQAVVVTEQELRELFEGVWSHGYDSNRPGNYYVNAYKKQFINNIIKGIQ